MRRFLLSTLIFLYCINSSNAQISSVKVNSSTENLGQNGVFYSLPRTVFQIDVVESIIRGVPGPYAAYAQKVLGLNDFIIRAETSYSIKGIYIHSFTEADPDAVYFLNFGERSSKTNRSFLFQLQANGVLKGMNESPFYDEQDRKVILELREDYIAPDFNYFADLNQVIRVDTIIRRIALDTTEIEDVVYNRTLVEKNILERAQDAATAYMDIRKNRLELLAGYQEVNYPAQTIQVMNSELQKIETDYLALFKGKRFISDKRTSFFVVPEGDKPSQTYPIFKFSKERGVTDLSTSYGERANLVVQTNGITDALKKQVSGIKTIGIFYRIPESARVWVDFRDTDYSKSTFIIPQLGTLQSVNSSKTVFSIDPKTGGIKAIEIK